MLITVFTPTYNRADKLHRVYNSLKNQTLKKIDTKFSIDYIKFWSKRFYFKTKYNLVYSEPYFNGYLVEEASYLYKGQDIQKLLNDYKIYKKYNLPFTLATHYWELKSGEIKENLDKFLEKVCIEK